MNEIGNHAADNHLQCVCDPGKYYSAVQLEEHWQKDCGNQKVESLFAEISGEGCDDLGEESGVKDKIKMHFQQVNQENQEQRVLIEKLEGENAEMKEEMHSQRAELTRLSH